MEKIQDKISFSNEDSSTKYFLLGTYENNNTFTYEMKINNFGKKKKINFTSIQQALEYVSYASTKPEKEIEKESLIKTCNEIMSCDTVEKMKNFKTEAKKRTDWSYFSEDGDHFPIACRFLFEIYLAKFEKNEKYLQVLMETGDKIIEETSDNSFLGINKKGKEDFLGKILMIVRAHLRKKNGSTKNRLEESN